MRAGEIVETGTHEELLTRRNGAYATLVQLQMSAQVCLAHHSSAPPRNQIKKLFHLQAMDPAALNDVSRRSLHTSQAKLLLRMMAVASGKVKQESPELWGCN